MANKEYQNANLHAEPEYLKLDLDGLSKELSKYDLAILPKIFSTSEGHCIACGNPCNPGYSFHEYCLFTIDYIRTRIREIKQKESKGVKAI